MAGISAIELSKQYLDIFYHGEEIIKVNVQQKTLNELLQNIIRIEITEIDIVSIDVEGVRVKSFTGV